MNTKHGLNILDFLATGISKEDPVIKAIISDENGKGAIANEVESLSDFINYYSRTNDVSKHKGTSLEMLASLFIKQRRRMNESDNVLARRFTALTARKGDRIWGNALNLKHLFEAYFNNITCYVVENTNRENLLSNDSFETDTDWSLSGGAVYSGDASFIGTRGVLFSGQVGQECSQALERLLLAGNYALHFFLYGKCGVIIQNEEGKYWNANAQKFSGDTVLEWVNEEAINYFYKSDEWNNVFCFITLPGDIHKLKVRFVSIEGEKAYIDYARIFIKPLNPSYTLYLKFDGDAISGKSLHLGIGENDPIQGVDYDNESYFDQSFIIGPEGESQSKAFETIFEIVRPRGIQGYIEFLNKR